MKLKKSITGCLVGIAFGCLGLSLFGTKSIQAAQQQSEWVKDQAGVLNQKTINQVDQINQQLTKVKGKPQYAVITTNHIGDGGNLDDYTQDLFDKYQIGQKGWDNGVLFVLAVKQHQYRFQTGYGMESVIPDGDAEQIVTPTVTKDLKAKKYSQAVSLVSSKTCTLIKQAKIMTPLQIKNARQKQLAQKNSILYKIGNLFKHFMSFLLFIGFILLFYSIGKFPFTVLSNKFLKTNSDNSRSIKKVLESPHGSRLKQYKKEYIAAGIKHYHLNKVKPDDLSTTQIANINNFCYECDLFDQQLPNRIADPSFSTNLKQQANDNYNLEKYSDPAGKALSRIVQEDELTKKAKKSLANSSPEEKYKFQTQSTGDGWQKALAIIAFNDIMADIIISLAGLRASFIDNDDDDHNNHFHDGFDGFGGFGGFGGFSGGGSGGSNGSFGSGFGGGSSGGGGFSGGW